MLKGRLAVSERILVISIRTFFGTERCLQQKKSGFSDFSGKKHLPPDFVEWKSNTINK
jgi:hypothetical protein